MHDLENSHWWFLARREIVLHLIDIYAGTPPGARYLDLGCGTGSMLVELEKRGEAVGVDLSGEALAYAAETTGAALFQASIENGMPEIEADFDCVLMLDLLEHLEDDAGAVRSAAGFLRQGGIAVVTVPAYRWLYAPRDTYHHHLRRYRAKEVGRLLEGAGLTLEIVSYYNTLLFVPAAVSRLVSKLRGDAPGPDLKMPRPLLNETLARVFAFEKHLLPRVGLPFGLSVLAVARAAG